jgi:hypothetical protein
MTYKVQIDDTVRDATPEEAALIEASHALAEQEKNLEIERQTANASARAKLAALGLTETEIKALVG